MRWLGWALAGPGIWAIGFALVYALHGAGCARGWGGVDLGAGLDLQRAVLWAGWLVTLAAGAVWLRVLPAPASPLGREAHLRHTLPRRGAWIGLVASAVTLLPVAVTSAC